MKIRVVGAEMVMAEGLIDGQT